MFFFDILGADGIQIEQKSVEGEHQLTSVRIFFVSPLLILIVLTEIQIMPMTTMFKCVKESA